VTSPFRCAAAAAERSEGLGGTASRADRFVLIEFPTPWPTKAIEVIEDDGLRAALAGAVAEANAKVLLIRRPGQRTGEQRRWAVIDARARQGRWGSWRVQSDLSDVVDVLGEAPSDVWGSEPVVLVCTHARHDACCGVWGRPIASVLAHSHADVVWESSHVGGHRFAGNLVFPLDGTYYGRVDTDGAPSLVHRHLGTATVAGDHLRGFSWMAPAAQAVAVEAHRRWGPAGVDDVISASASALGPDRWRVELTGGDVLPSSITAEVERVAGPEARMSCRADPMPTESFVIRTLDASGQ
jgi:hypothetical protein